MIQVPLGVSRASGGDLKIQKIHKIIEIQQGSDDKRREDTEEIKEHREKWRQKRKESREKGDERQVPTRF